MEVNVEISEDLYQEISKKFKKESIKIFKKLKSLEDTPKQGKKVGKVGRILIKELKYESFRFYFIVDGIRLKLLSKGELDAFLVKFVKMSKKNGQNKVIEEIKETLRDLGY